MFSAPPPERNAANLSKSIDSTPYVELNDVSFGYTRDRKILSGVTLKVPRGKLVAVMGGSGCGKTTILRLIVGNTTPPTAAFWSVVNRLRRCRVKRSSRIAESSACCFNSARCSPT
jgi:ABC-type transporter Mla maintaining outer membrane lipid asymmetry ATPase subunit MlaF